MAPSIDSTGDIEKKDSSSIESNGTVSLDQNSSSADAKANIIDIAEMKQEISKDTKVDSIGDEVKKETLLVESNGTVSIEQNSSPSDAETKINGVSEIFDSVQNNNTPEESKSLENEQKENVQTVATKEEQHEEPEKEQKETIPEEPKSVANEQKENIPKEATKEEKHEESEKEKKETIPEEPEKEQRETIPEELKSLEN